MTQPEHPLDLGIVLGSTCDDIWSAEIARHDGLIALREMLTCEQGGCDASDRQHFQHFFRGADHDVMTDIMTGMSMQKGKDRKVIREFFQQNYVEPMLQVKRKRGLGELLAGLFDR